jgi:formylmethanofuran dehydrogenase subunit C
VLTLTLRTQPDVPLELDGVTPDLLLKLAAADVARLPVAHGNRTVELGAFFAVTGDASGGDVSIVGDCSRVKLIGAGMTAGRMTVEGDAGWHAGAKMTGGTLTVLGDAADWLGAEMTGGAIAVRGHAGHQCGAAYRGSRHGMRGGTIVVHKSCGDEAGLLMRRGLIAVVGAVGQAAGASMIAGTLVALGGVGRDCGAGLKRGTIVVGGPEPVWPPGVRFSCEYAPAYLGVLAKELAVLGFPTQDFEHVAVRCFRGDLLHGGHGELLHLAQPQASRVSPTR